MHWVFIVLNSLVAIFFSFVSDSYVTLLLTGCLLFGGGLAIATLQTIVTMHFSKIKKTTGQWFGTWMWLNGSLHVFLLFVLAKHLVL